MATIYPESLPGELKNAISWALWRRETRDGKTDKVPYRIDGVRAKSNMPASWCKFDTAFRGYQENTTFDGVCWMMSWMRPEEPGGFVFIDIDHCIKNGIIEPWAQEVIDKFNSYTEKSQSGNGVHILIRGKKPIQRCRKAGSPFEIYDCLRACYLTGDVVDGHTVIGDRQAVLDGLFEKVFAEEMKRARQGPAQKPSPAISNLSDEALYLKAKSAKGGSEFEALWKGSTSEYGGDNSAADMALMNKLAFWTGGNSLQMERMFSNSALGMRDKWKNRPDYRERTIKKAIADAREFYKPPSSESSRTYEDAIKGIDFEELTEGGNAARLERIPSIRPVCMEDNEGSVGIGPEGTICKVGELEDKKSGETKKFLGWVSDCALHIETETRSKDETEFNFAGTGATDKRSVRFTLPAGALAEPKKFKAALLNAFGAKNRIGALNFEMVQEISLNPRLMQRVEVPAWDGNTPLLPGVGLVGNVEFRLSPKIPASVHDGDLQAAGDVLKKLLTVHRFAPLVVAAIMGAPAVARWHKGDRFGLGLWGQTGTLKTSIVLAAMGIYGPGYLDAPRLKAGKGGATLVAAMEIFAAAGFLPQLYDNIKNVDIKDSQTYIAAMHAVLEGEEKARGKKDGGLRESREFLCTPIVTGEVRPQEASTSARVLNLNWSQPDANLLADVQKNAAMLPVIGYQWLRFLAETDCVLGKDFEAFRSKKIDEFLKLKYVNPGRLATIYALMVGIWQLLEESPMGDVFTEAHESFKTALDVATAAQGQAVAEETEIERFLSGLEELLASNPGLIMSEDGKKTIAGAVIGKWMPDGLFLLPTETLNELGKIKAFSQQPTPDSITQGLQDKGVLIPDPDGKHLKYRMRFNGGRPWGWYIKNVVPINPELSSPGGDGKNDSNRASVPNVPTVHSEKERKNFSENLQKNHDRLLDKKEFHHNGGDSGDSGDSRVVDRLVDSDFDSKVGVPIGVPTEGVGEDTLSSECGNKPAAGGEETPTPTPAPALEQVPKHDCGSCQVALRGDRSAIKPECGLCSYLAGKGGAPA